MNSDDWLDRLQMLLARYSNIALDADMASLSLIELWGVYCYLSRLAES